MAVLTASTGCGAGAELREAMASAQRGAPSAATPDAAMPDPAAAEPSAPGGPAVPCTAATLSVSTGPASASGAEAALDLIFQNTGDAACVLRGFPSVVAVSGNEATPVGDPALPVGARGDAVRLEPRAAATVPLRVRDPAGYDERECRPQPVRGLRVLPPGGTGAIFVAREGTACSAAPLDPPWATVGTVVAR